jgi:hypothetical protein
MKQAAKAITLVLFVSLLSGCSASTPESKPVYDELEVIRYRVCVEKMVEHMAKQPLAESAYTYEMVRTAEKYCKPIEPVKK